MEASYAKGSDKRWGRGRGGNGEGGYDPRPRPRAGANDRRAISVDGEDFEQGRGGELQSGLGVFLPRLTRLVVSPAMTSTPKKLSEVKPFTPEELEAWRKRGRQAAIRSLKQPEVSPEEFMAQVKRIRAQANARAQAEAGGGAVVGDSTV